MSEKKTGTIRIQWVRSGIGFPRRQRELVKSLGLGRLNHIVEREDTPQIRGLIAKAPHLVAIVGSAPRRRAAAIPEYTVLKAWKDGGEPASQAEPENPAE